MNFFLKVIPSIAPGWFYSPFKRRVVWNSRLSTMGIRPGQLFVVKTKDVFTNITSLVPAVDHSTIRSVFVWWVVFACFRKQAWEDSKTQSYPRVIIRTQASVPKSAFAASLLPRCLLALYSSPHPTGATATSEDTDCSMHFQPEGNLLESWEQKVTNHKMKTWKPFCNCEKKFVTINVVINR